MGDISNVQELETSHSLPYADLATLDLALLRAGDVRESARLLEACKTFGFFYLDLSADRGIDMLESHDKIVEFIHSYMAQPLETKLQDSVNDDKRGYKPAGLFSGVETGRKDNFENLKVSRSDLYIDHHLAPPSTAPYRPHLERFTRACDSISQLILSSLSTSLSLGASSRLEDSHRPPQPSTTFLGLLHYPSASQKAGRGHNKHTDIGTLTILITTKPGLQALTPEGWRRVEPRAGHAVVNVGDALRFLSRGALKSCVHRVDPPGDGGARTSVCYFLRPEDDAVLFEAPDGRPVTARAWHDGKFLTFREDHDVQAKAKVLTGGMEERGRLVGV